MRSGWSDRCRGLVQNPDLYSGGASHGLVLHWRLWLPSLGCCANKAATTIDALVSQMQLISAAAYSSATEAMSAENYGNRASALYGAHFFELDVLAGSWENLLAIILAAHASIALGITSVVGDCSHYGSRIPSSAVEDSALRPRSDHAVLHRACRNSREHDAHITGAIIGSDRHIGSRRCDGGGGGASSGPGF